MLRKTLLFIFTTFISFSAAFAQSGKLSGKIIDTETNEPIPFANIVALQNGIQKGGSTSDFDGKYRSTPLSPGSYDVVVSVVGYEKRTFKDVIINFETTTRLNINIATKAGLLDPVHIYAKPLIDHDNTSTGAKLTAKEIELLPTRNINAIVNTTGGVFSSDDGEAVIIAGTRSGATQYHLNGVKLFGEPVVPKTALADLTIIRSGIPAQYGDLLGGVVSMTTKTPTSKITGNIEAETSMLFDKWRY
ncbi:MAG: TonB-dependent receptor, partial [Bacteroidetes bacterium]|nr:TonB-dependent receptor [Bacteroidota bacterium]